MAFAGTTLSIILTFGTSALIDHVNRNRDRKLTAMMVLSSIESSIRSLEETDAIMARKDTLAHWLLAIPESEVRELPDEVLLPPISEMMITYSVSTDRTIENIFSSNTEIWKNVGNFQYIDNVGKCYTSLRVIESDWKEQMRSISVEFERVVEHPEDYPGETLAEKTLTNKAVRIQMAAIPQRREWLKYVIHALRETNRRNMALIGISEKEVMAFTDKQKLAGDFSSEDAVNEAFFRGEFAIPPISLDSLYTMRGETQLLDSLRRARN